MKDDHIKMNRDRLHQGVSGQMIEFNDRETAPEGRGSKYRSRRFLRPKRPPSRKRSNKSARERGRYNSSAIVIRNVDVTTEVDPRKLRMPQRTRSTTALAQTESG